MTAAERGSPIAVCVSGNGSNLRALRRAELAGWLGATIGLVLADRECPALAFAAAERIPTRVVSPDGYDERRSWDEAVAGALRSSGAKWVVLAGFMRLLGRPVLDAFPGRVLNVHPSLLPSFSGAHAVRDAIAAGVKQTGVTVHVVDEAVDAGPIVAQEPVPVLAGDDEAALAERLHAVEHRLLPHVVALAVAGALRVDGRLVSIDPLVSAALPRRRRALLSVSDKAGLVELGRALVKLGFELVSTGGTARALRASDLDVTDVASVTGFPEMLDGRVKTLHPRIHGGVLADLGRAEHRAQLASAAIEPFELVVVNLYPFEEATLRPDVTLDELIEEIDIGGPALVRAAAKNHASVAVVTDPEQYDAVVRELREAGTVGETTRAELAAAAFFTTSAYDLMIGATLVERLARPQAPEPLAAAPDLSDPRFPSELTLDLERVLELRYGENPHQAAALYALPDASSSSGPFAGGVDLLQGKPLSYNNILDASAAAALARDLRGAGCAVVKHTNPCGAAEAPDLIRAWERALAGDPVSSFGGVVALTGPIDRRLAEALTSIFLEVVVAPGLEDQALEILSAKPNLRVLLDAGLGSAATPSIEFRSAGGALLATESDVRRDDPAHWRVVTRREPTAEELADLDLAWRVARHVKSNAIVLTKAGSVVGVGAGQMSRVDSARLAVAKAGAERAVGAACASDAFYPFPDGVQACTDAGVTSFVQPGGSQRDREVIAAADAAGASMVLTGIRHFRH